MKKYISKFLSKITGRSKKRPASPTIEDAVIHCIRNGSPGVTTYCIVLNPITGDTINLQVDIVCSIVDMPPLKKEGNVIQFPIKPDTNTIH